LADEEMKKMPARKKSKFVTTVALAAVVAACCVASGCNFSNVPMPGQQSAAANSAATENAAQGRNARGLPSGFQVYNDPQGSGRMLHVKFTGGTDSAAAAMRQYLGSLSGYFDGAPQLIGAVGDPQDKVVQAAWTGKINGQPVRGMAAVILGKGEGTFALLYDKPESFAASFGRMTQALAPQIPKSATASGGGGNFTMAPEQNWRRQSGGDGSAAASVPDGWRVTGAAKGAMDIVGPNKEVIELGLAAPIFTSPMPGSRPGSFGPYLNPMDAVKFYEAGMNYLTLQNSPPDKFGRIVESTPVPSQNGQAMYALQELDTSLGHRKVFLFMATIPPSGTNEWILYTSYAASDASTFAQDLPTMLKIWASWKVSDATYRARMESAIANMKETNNIVHEVIENQQKAFDNANIAFDEVLRGNWPVENTETGERREFSQDVATALEKYCQAQSYPCRQVPTSELSGH
jgi:hypothetical protein